MIDKLFTGENIIMERKLVGGIFYIGEIIDLNKCKTMIFKIEVEDYMKKKWELKLDNGLSWVINFASIKF